MDFKFDYWTMKYFAIELIKLNNNIRDLFDGYKCSSSKKWNENPNISWDNFIWKKNIGHEYYCWFNSSPTHFAIFKIQRWSLEERREKNINRAGLCHKNENSVYFWIDDSPLIRLNPIFPSWRIHNLIGYWMSYLYVVSKGVEN